MKAGDSAVDNVLAVFKRIHGKLLKAKKQLLLVAEPQHETSILNDVKAVFIR